MKQVLVRIKNAVPRTLVYAGVAVIALGGTAVAGKMITGKDIKNNSITGKDVKDSSLSPDDFSGSVQGPQGPPGLSESMSASADPNPDTTVASTGYTDVVTGQITVDTPSRLIVDGTAVFYMDTTGAYASDCEVRINGSKVGHTLRSSINDESGAIVSMSQGGTVGAGTHSVALSCRAAMAGVTQTISFDQGTLTAIATGQ